MDSKLEIQKNSSLLIGVRKYTHLRWLHRVGKGALDTYVDRFQCQ